MPTGSIALKISKKASGNLFNSFFYKFKGSNRIDIVENYNVKNVILKGIYMAAPNWKDNLKSSKYFDEYKITLEEQFF